MKPLCHVTFGRIIWSRSFYTYIEPRFKQAVASVINKLWASSFFWKWSKFNIDLENARKKGEKVFSFWDNCMWMGYIKLFLWGREHLSTGPIVLTNSLKLLHITKRDFLQLNCLPLDQSIWYRCFRSDSKWVETCLPCSFWNSNLNRDFHTYI